MSRKLRSEPKKPRPSAKLTELPSAAAHREVAQCEDDNVGVEAANRTTQAAEGGARYAAKLSTRPRHEAKSEPQGAKQQQKRGIKDAYTKARQGKSTTTATAKGAKKAAEKEKKTAQFIYRHRKGIGIAAALFLAVAFIMNALTSCSVFLQGGLNSVGLTTYPVSYTHLDVYKRQSLSSGLCWKPTARSRDGRLLQSIRMMATRG